MAKCHSSTGASECFSAGGFPLVATSKQFGRLFGGGGTGGIKGPGSKVGWEGVKWTHRFPKLAVQKDICIGLVAAPFESANQRVGNDTYWVAA